jgi:hypothetical protein
MDVIKYRKWYLQRNWGENIFRMIKYGVEFKEIRIRRNNKIMTIDFQRNHPLVLAKKAYWLNDRELCIGYKMDSNPDIFRPIFSHKRQRLLDRLNKFEAIYSEDGKFVNEDDMGNTIDDPYKFWNKIKSKYFMLLVKMNSKNIPIDCVEYIVMFIL